MAEEEKRGLEVHVHLIPGQVRDLAQPCSGLRGCEFMWRKSGYEVMRRMGLGEGFVTNRMNSGCPETMVYLSVIMVEDVMISD